MGVDQTSLDRIRNATFPSSRRGYDKREVEKFLARLADWLETGAGDESRSDTVKRELERVGQRTGAILAQAEESAQQIREEAQEEARQVLTEANAEAESVRGDADSYAGETRDAADTYAKETRAAADGDAASTREGADSDAAETIEQAQAQARRVVEEGNTRRLDIEAVIGDLVDRRDSVLAGIEELSGKLSVAASEHRPPDGADPFDTPDQLDPLEGEAEIAEESEEVSDDREEASPEEEPEEEPADEGPAEDDAGDAEDTEEKPRGRRKAAKTRKAPKRTTGARGGSRSRKVKS